MVVGLPKIIHQTFELVRDRTEPAAGHGQCTIATTQAFAVSKDGPIYP
jgi:hypothetical protein